MDSGLQEQCMIASRNARALEEILLTYDSVIALGSERAEDVISRCYQIIDCMENMAEWYRGKESIDETHD